MSSLRRWDAHMYSVWCVPEQVQAVEIKNRCAMCKTKFVDGYNISYTHWETTCRYLDIL